MVTPSADDLRTWADGIGPDTPLARFLLLRGRLPLDLLQATLNEVRAARPEGGTLAARLVERGLVELDELKEWRVLLAAEGPLVDTWPEAGRSEGPDAWRPGAVVAEHRLVSRIGSGGMGAVDLAEHLPTGARRAIKSIPAGADADLVARFRREAEAMAQAGDHPAVARIHAVGQALGRLYLVMDLLPGGDLEHRLRAGPLPADEVARLGVTLAAGLAHIHARGFLHRDLKPSNVLFDDAGRPVLVDFGLARFAGSSNLTRTGDLLGTPAYMAPEQALGLAREQDARTDVHGLGAVLYRALTGQLPFQGATAYELLERVIHAAPTLPSSLVKGVPPALEVAILRAMAKRPEERFQSAAAFGAALSDALVALKPGDTAPAARPRRVRIEADLTPIILVALAILAAGVGLGLLLAPAAQPPATGPAPGGHGPAPVATGRAPSPPRPAPATPARPVKTLPASVADIGAPPEAAPAGLTGVRLEQWRVVHDVGPMADLQRPLTQLNLATNLKDDVLRADAPPDDPRAVLAAQLLKELVRPGAGTAPNAWRELGRLFALGVGVRASGAEAVRCYEEGARLGDGLSALALATAYRTGDLGLPVDRARARPYFDVARGPRSDMVRRATLLAGRAALEDGSAADLVSLGTALATTGEEGAVRALVLGRLGEADAEVERLLRELVGDAGGSGSALTGLHALLVRTGRAAEASELLSRVEPRAAGLDVRLALARLHRQAGSAARAVAWYLLVARTPGQGPEEAATAACELLDLRERELAAGRPDPCAAGVPAELEQRLGSSYEARSVCRRLRGR